MQPRNRHPRGCGCAPESFMFAGLRQLSVEGACATKPQSINSCAAVEHSLWAVSLAEWGCAARPLRRAAAAADALPGAAAEVAVALPPARAAMSNYQSAL